MNELIIFNNPEFGEIRTVEVNGEPWFVGKDVATALGYKNPQEAVRNHVDDEEKGVSEILTPGGRLFQSSTRAVCIPWYFPANCPMQRGSSGGLRPK